MNHERMSFLDFFAGIGTIRMGFEQAGWVCKGHVEWDKFAQASYNAMHEIKEDEYCGWDITKVRADELPRADLWAFGAPCQDFSIAGNRQGLKGERSSLVYEIFRLIEETPEENRPTWLLYENVKGMLSSNGGWDFLGILLEMDRLGYDVEWQLLNSKDWGVPQNRERVFTLGNLRGRGGRKVFPITDERRPSVDVQGQHIGTITTRTGVNGTVGTYIVEGEQFSQKINQIGNLIDTECNQAVVEPKVIDDQGRIKDSYKQHDIVPTLRAQTHGNPPKVTVIEKASELKFVGGLSEEPNWIQDGKRYSRNFKQGSRVYDADGLAASLSSQGVGGPGGHTGLYRVRVSEISPPKIIDALYNNRPPREYEDAAPTLRSDRHGVAIMRPKRTDYGKQIRKQYESGEIEESRHNMTTLEPVFDGISNTITTVQKDNLLLDNRQCMRIRKLTPKECWRLQGVPDHYFDKASAVNSDSQLYKQAGNACTVNVIFEVARRIGREETA